MRCALQIGAKARFITQRPHQNRRAVLIPNDRALDAVEHGIGKLGIVTQQAKRGMFALIIELTFGVGLAVIDAKRAVRLQIGLGDHIKAHPCTQFGQPRCIRVMTGAQRIEIMLFHHAQIAQNMLSSDGIADKGVAVMAIDALDLDIDAVDVQHRVPNGNVLDTDLLDDGLAVSADDQLIECRVLSIPQHRMVKGKVHVPARVGRLLRQLRAVRCVQRAHRLPGCTVPDNRQVNRGFAQIIRHRGAHGIVKNMVLRTVHQVYIAKNTAHAQLVLIFQITAVAPFHHQYGQPVASGMDKGTDIKRAGRVRNLAVSHQISINSDIKARIHALKVQLGHLVRGIQRKIGHIRASGIVLRDVRRVEWERIADVGILMPVISEHLPAARHRDGIPAGGVKVGFFECIGHVPRVRIVGEAPSAAEQGIRAERVRS